MDASKFDAATQRLSHVITRRHGLSLLSALSISVGLLAKEGDAKKHKKTKKVTLCLKGQTVKVPRKQRGGYLSQGATPGACTGPCSPDCSVCGANDGCGGICACEAGQTCLSNGSCGKACAAIQDCGDQTTCHCNNSLGGEPVCRTALATPAICNAAPACQSTSDCPGGTACAPGCGNPSRCIALCDV